MDAGPFENFTKEPSALTPGVTACVALADGRLVVAKVLRVRTASVLLHVWGRAEPEWISRQTIEGAGVCPAHSAHDRLEASRRIRATGSVLGAAWPRQVAESSHIAIDPAKLAEAMTRNGIRSNAFGGKRRG